MTYEEFIEKMPVPFEVGREDRREVPGSEYIEETWITGGETGSNWRGSESRPLDGEPEPEFVVLDRVLEHFCPQITFLQYKGIVRDCVRYGSDEERSGYYGERTEYSFKRIKLKKLFDRLISSKLIS
jgi:hypothetical protein